MILFKEAIALQNYIHKLKNEGNTIGFVPTMGALHNGHLSLIEACKQIADVTVVSIFVNPTQFNDKSDFEKYPSTIAEDILKLEQVHCNILFLPSVEEMYPDGTATQTHYDLGHLEQVYEGLFRPGHFQGVCQVVDRLLSIVTPDKVLMGQKDFQQCRVVERLIKILKLPVQLVIAQTTREASGLAMSSRNMRLNKAEKEAALNIYKVLQHIKEHYKQVDYEAELNEQKQYLLERGFTKIDYVSIADAETLQPQSSFNKDKKYVALVAAYLNDVRLIDNMLLED